MTIKDLISLEKISIYTLLFFAYSSNEKENEECVGHLRNIS